MRSRGLRLVCVDEDGSPVGSDHGSVFGELHLADARRGVVLFVAPNVYWVFVGLSRASARVVERWASLWCLNA
jgi:hypothetical protein